MELPCAGSSGIEFSGRENRRAAPKSVEYAETPHLRGNAAFGAICTDPAFHPVRCATEVLCPFKRHTLETTF